MLMAALLFAMLAGENRPNPLESYVAWSRRELAAAGLERRTTGDGSVYWIGGKADGRTLVLLHGSNDQAGTWAGTVRMLMTDYRLILPDLAGHGESEPRNGPITFPLMLERVHAVIEREAKGKVTIGGNSMGGWLSTLYALDHPDRVERLVLENGSGLLWPVTISLMPKTREEAAIAMKAVNGPNDKTPDEVLDALVNRKNPPLARLVLSDILKYLVDSRLQELKMPVTIIWGRLDGILPVAYAESLHKQIPGSTLTIIDSAGHIPHRQQPARFVECLNATY